MAETITYPENSYGIMPSDAFNKYIRFNNQRRAATGLGATETDKKAFWEGTMEGVIKNSATRAAQNLENKRYALSELNSNRSYELQKEQLENQKSASDRSAISGLAQIPMTYLMYDTLGLSKTGKKPLLSRGADWLGESYDSLFGIEPASDTLGMRLADEGTSMTGWDTAIPEYNSYDPGDWWDIGSSVASSVGEDAISSVGDSVIDWSDWGDVDAFEILGGM